MFTCIGAIYGINRREENKGDIDKFLTRGQLADFVAGLTVLTLGILAANNIGIPKQWTPLLIGIGSGYYLTNTIFALTGRCFIAKNDMVKKIVMIVATLVLIVGIAGLFVRQIPPSLSLGFLGAGGASLLAQMFRHCVNEYHKSVSKKILAGLLEADVSKASLAAAT